MTALGREKSRTLGPRQGVAGDRRARVCVRWAIPGGVWHSPVCNLVGCRKSWSRVEVRSQGLGEEVPTLTGVRDLVA